jgi:hypothetical protein
VLRDHIQLSDPILVDAQWHYDPVLLVEHFKLKLKNFKMHFELLPIATQNE